MQREGQMEITWILYFPFIKRQGNNNHCKQKKSLKFTMKIYSTKDDNVQNMELSSFKTVDK